LEYISRNGQLELEGADGALIASRRDEWAGAALADRSRRKNSPVSHSVILSMPAGTSKIAVRGAARSFAADMFAGRHDYVFTLHTDTPRPHVHLSICSRGHAGERLNPKKADLELWRQTFAQALRDRGVEAEARARHHPRGRADIAGEDPGSGGGAGRAHGACPPVGLS
jgi:type IV secretory pathway VirD2 relaxase